MMALLQGAAYAQTFEQVVEKFEDKKGAEVLKVPGILMKVALALTDKDESMPPEAKEFLKHISSMTLLDMSDCSNADKQASRHITTDTAENTSTILTSFQPHFSKWWWMGAILKIRLPWVILK